MIIAPGIPENGHCEQDHFNLRHRNANLLCAASV